MPELVTEEAALADIAAAADSVDALAVAIEKAAFLDNKPGEGRQQLRGKCCHAIKWNRCGRAGHTPLNSRDSDQWWTSDSRPSSLQYCLQG